MVYIVVAVPKPGISFIATGQDEHKTFFSKRSWSLVDIREDYKCMYHAFIMYYLCLSTNWCLMCLWSFWSDI